MPPKHRLFRNVRRTIMAVAMLLVVEYLVLPQFARARASFGLLAHVKLRFIFGGLGLEIAAIVAYAQLTRAVLPRDSAPTLWRALRINLSSLALTHVIPGGSATSTAVGYRLLTEEDIPGTDAAFALATQGIGSAVVLNALLWLGLVVSIPLRGFNPLYGTVAVLGAVVIGGFSFVVVTLTKGAHRAAHAMSAIARALPFLDESGVHAMVLRLSERLRALAADRPLLVRAVGWATANWVLDAASLWVFLLAFGPVVSLDGLIVSFGLANVIAAIPITPGGLGVVEGVLVPTLVGFGATRPVAILGVISYRLVNFWLPIPLGGLAYVSLRRQSGKTRAPVQELREIAEASLDAGDTPRTWATSHGVKKRG